MTQEQFVTLCKEFLEREHDLLAAKAGDYAVDNDRLWNFHAQGQLEGKRPSEIALTHLLKHVLSLVKAVRTGSGEWAWVLPEGREGLKQRFADARNYLLLLAACLEEERRGKNGEEGKGDA